VTGLPPGEISSVGLPPARRPRLIAISAAAALALSALAAFSIAAHSAGVAAHGAGPGPVITPQAPFPSLTTTSQPARSAPPTQNIMPSAITSALVSPSPTMTTATATTSPTPSATWPAVTATYVVASRWDDGFKAKVRVYNGGPAPISGWQIVVALPDDWITSVSNANGYVSNHILLLQPSASTDTVPAGGELTVSFTVHGTRTMPELCAFNNLTCE
jgi:hypothetical protein